jgi:hypothetical protein
MEAARAVGIRGLVLDDLLPHHGVLSGTILTERSPPNADKKKAAEAWRESFWRLLWMVSDGGKRSPQLGAFNDWRILHVYASGGGEAFIPWAEATSVFSMEGIEPQWKVTISNIIHRVGFHVLAPAMHASALPLIRPRVQSGEEGLCHLLSLSPNTVRELPVKEKLQILEYFASRRELPAFVASQLKAMPLFLLPQPGAFTDLNARFKYAAISHENGFSVNRVSNLQLLEIPGVVHLALPTTEIYALYKALGVSLLPSSVFVEKHVCPNLASTAKDGKEKFRQLLSELQCWVVVPANQNKPCSDEMLEKIVRAAGAQAFVQTMHGEFVTAKNVLHPNRRITNAFEVELERWLPHKTLKPYIKLLDRLGMLQKLSADCIVVCAKSLDSEAAAASGHLSEVTARRSFFLVEELSHALIGVFQQLRRRDGSAVLQITSGEQEEKTKLVYAARLRVILVRRCSGSDAKQFTEQLAASSHYHSLVGSGDSRPAAPGSVHLARFDSELSISDERLVWTQLSVLACDAYGACRKEHASAGLTSWFDKLRHDYSDDVHSSLGCVCSDVQVSLDLLAKQLWTVTNALPLGVYDCYTHLSSDLQILFGAIAAWLLVDPEATQLSTFSNVHCVPLHTMRDASGVLGTPRLRLALPSEVFFRLPDGARHSLQGYLHEAPLEPARVVLEKLGVRAEPKLSDWLSCLQHIGESAAKNDDKGVLLPNQVSPANYVLDKILLALPDRDVELGPLELYLFDEDMKLLNSKTLVYVDAPRLRRRCKEIGLGFAKLGPGVSGNLLCQHSELQCLSTMVREELIDDTPTNPPDDEDGLLEALITSAEFADSLVACCRNGKGIAIADVRRALSIIKFCWSSAPLTTSLYLCAPGSQQALAGSQATTSTFAQASDGSPCLWLQSGVLGSDDGKAERAFFTTLGTEVLPRLLQVCSVPVAVDLSLYVDLLYCWRSGPESLQEACALRDVTIEALKANTTWAPGSWVTPVDLKFVQQNPNCTFLVGETVAVRCDDDKIASGTRYRCAKVLPLGDAGSSENSGADIARMYLLDLGSLPERR